MNAVKTILHLLLRLLAAVLGLALMIAACCWLLGNIHPDSSVETSVTAQSKYKLSSSLAVHQNNAKSDALTGLAYIEKIISYSIPETDLVAPKPDPKKFGSTTDPTEITKLMNEFELSTGTQTAWSEDADFFPGQDFRYYCDDTILVVCWKEIIAKKVCSCAEVYIADGSQLRRKIADDTYGSSVQLYASDMAESVNAVVAINGDFYSFRNLGITVYQRKLYRCNPLHVDTCFFTAGGDMLFSYAGEIKSEEEAQKFIDDNDVVFAVAFGPVLIENGEQRRIDNYAIGEVNGYYSRSCIGMLGEKHYFLMTMNEEGKCTDRCMINELGSNMLNKGCVKAYTLDGGQTSVMIMNGTAFNRVDWGHERTMSDIIYFATAIPSGEG